MLPAFGRKLRWLTGAVIAMALVSAGFLALDVIRAGASRTSIEVWQRVLEATGTIAVAMLYLWREYLQDAPVRTREEAGPPPAPQIVQNIYPPSAAPPAAPKSDLDKTIDSRERGGNGSRIETGTITARRLAIVDESGRERIGLGVDSAGHPELHLRDGHGRVRASLAIGDNGHAALQLFDGAERRRALLAVRHDGFGELALLDRAGAVRAVLGAAGDDAVSYLGLRTDSTYAVVLEGREVSQSLWDEAARLAWSMPIRPAR